MLKVMTVLGTRPEIIRLSRTIFKLDKYTDHTLVHTGQNFDYELNEVFFKDLEIRKPDYFLDSAKATPAETIGNLISSSDLVMESVKPDALLILGDTNSSLVAIAAKRKKIPIFHMEAGNRCFDFNVPEEINRKIVDHISDINLTYSEIARDYLLREGLPPDQIIRTGSPLKEVIDFSLSKISTSSILDTLKLKEDNFFVVSSHREENVDNESNLKKLISILNVLAKQFKKPIVFSTHPRTKKRLDALDLKLESEIKFFKPFGFFDYLKLQKSATCVLSDSGTITEESSIINFPALNIRECHERPEGFEEGSVMMVGLNVNRVMDALAVLQDQPRGDTRLLKMVADYQPENVSEKVLRIILSYTDYVNKVVWGKI